MSVTPIRPAPLTPEQARALEAQRPLPREVSVVFCRAFLDSDNALEGFEFVEAFEDDAEAKAYATYMAGVQPEFGPWRTARYRLVPDKPALKSASDDDLPVY